MPAEAQIQQLLDQARRAREHAYAPYSHFTVGAAVLTAAGEIFTGANIENASFGATICAERLAIFTAVAAGRRDLDGPGGHRRHPRPRRPLRPVPPGVGRIQPGLCHHHGQPAGRWQLLTLKELLPLAFRLPPPERRRAALELIKGEKT